MIHLGWLTSLIMWWEYILSHDTRILSYHLRIKTNPYRLVWTVCTGPRWYQYRYRYVQCQSRFKILVRWLGLVSYCSIPDRTGWNQRVATSQEKKLVACCSSLLLLLCCIQARIGIVPLCIGQNWTETTEQQNRRRSFQLEPRRAEQEKKLSARATEEEEEEYWMLTLAIEPPLPPPPLLSLLRGSQRTGMHLFLLIQLLQPRASSPVLSLLACFCPVWYQSKPGRMVGAM